jgi:MinD-like ATPase involved in chromosome partitioning or flagellar assembly
VANRLDTPKTNLVVNKVLAKYDPEAVREQVSQKFQVPVLGVFPVSEEMIELGSKELFVLTYPNHPYTTELKNVAHHVLT